ncbi:helix-turn-helix domain-containing protein [Spirosoma flavum]|uniref:Helix-turn-helix domain-containing protein n=1 Tax=Spirosoma flavum TaxID=2048557 RepID=A0ABW6AJ86_9BACT
MILNSQTNPPAATLSFQSIEPEGSMADFVHYFWQLTNATTEPKTVTILPDGYFDLLFSVVNNQPVQGSLVGLITQPVDYLMPINATTFAISFKLPAAEYLFNTSMADLVNKSTAIPLDFWGFAPADFADFTHFVSRANQLMTTRSSPSLDPRKLALFVLLYSTNGDRSITDISATIHWSPRQLNRYFTRQFGLSLKAYCTLLRYRASFGQLMDGKLYPQQGYADQAHFSKEIKKYSRATPKQLAANKKDRFIQLSTLSKP